MVVRANRLKPRFHSAATKATTRANTAASHQPNTPCSNHATGTGNKANTNNTAPPNKGTAAIFCKPSYGVRTDIMFASFQSACFTLSLAAILHHMSPI